jgi:pimeloyl-ACP methyl ester carboxylesterase
MLPEAELTLMRARHRGGDPQLDRLFAHAREFAADRDDVNFDAATLGRVTARSLIVYGDRDPLYPVSSGVELFERMPQSALWVVPNGGHGPIFGAHAEAFRRVALAFLRE